MYICTSLLQQSHRVASRGSRMTGRQNIHTDSLYSLSAAQGTYGTLQYVHTSLL